MAAAADAPAPGRVIGITGMHRSGTSLAARAVNLLGVWFGSADSLLAPGSDNPAGYWENRAIKELNDELLARLGGSWDQPPVLPPGWELDPALEDLRAHACSVMERDLPVGHGGLLGFKDPRLSLLAPFWGRVVPIEATIVVVRSPRQVAGSLSERNGLGEAEAGTLWLRYLLAAVGQCPNPLVVRHDDLLGDLPATLTEIAQHLGLGTPGDEVHDLVEAHVDRTLVHHVDGDGPAAADLHPVLAMAELVWDGGAVDVDALPASVTDAITVGWLGPPGNRSDLMAARAEAVDLRERLRKRLREIRGTEPGAVPTP